MVKNLPAMQETQVRSLGWEDPLEKETATHSGILAWTVPWTLVHGVTKSLTRRATFSFSSFSDFIGSTELKIRNVEYECIYRKFHDWIVLNST